MIKLVNYWSYLFTNWLCDKSAQTDVLKNILPLNTILRKFSELDIGGLCRRFLTPKNLKVSCIIEGPNGIVTRLELGICSPWLSLRLGQTQGQIWPYNHPEIYGSESGDHCSFVEWTKRKQLQIQVKAAQVYIYSHFFEL